jgi:hypothetical protein
MQRLERRVSILLSAAKNRVVPGHASAIFAMPRLMASARISGNGPITKFAVIPQFLLAGDQAWPGWNLIAATGGKVRPDATRSRCYLNGNSGRRV